MADLPEGTVTFLFSDVEGSTKLLEQHATATGDALSRHHQVFDELATRHHGVIFETVGDAAYAVFARPTDAVAAALDAHRALAAADWGPIGRLAVRIALHTGVVERRGDHYFGSALFRAARLQGLAHGEQTLLSGVTAGLVRDALPDGAALRDLGSHRLKDLGEAEQVYQLTHPELRADFPPLRSLDAHPHNLPVQLSSFVGREAELAEVGELLDEHRLVTLLGPPGIGKTRLVLQVAADRLERHPDGVFFVDLAALRDPEMVPSAIATTLGLREQPGQGLDQLLSEYLTDKQLLLILDNLEQLLPPTAATVAELLGNAPGLRVLTTSRAPLRVRGEHRYQVPSLATGDPGRLESAPPAAAALFAERARELEPDFTVDDTNGPPIADICARLDGLPLAIELAVARLPLLGLKTLHERLAQRLPLLTGGPRDLPARQQTLHDAIAWSEELLAEPERRLFARLGVFAGSFDLPAVAAICGPGLQADVLVALDALVSQSLVRHAESGPDGEPRFTLLATIREYAAERLEASEEIGEVRGRHAAHYLQVAEESAPLLHGSGQADLFLRMRADHDNFRTVLDWSIGSRAVETGIRLAAALCWFWTLRDFSEGRTWCRRLLDAAHDAPAGLRAQARLTDGTLAYLQGRSRDAQAILHEALQAFSSDKNHSGAARALCWLASAAVDLGQADDADALFARGLDEARAAGDLDAQRWLLGNRAFVYTMRGQIDAGREGWLDVLRSSEEIGDSRSVMVAVGNVGTLDYLAGDLSSAERRLGEALERAKALGMADACAEAAADLARVRLEAGETATAAEVLLEAWERGWILIGDRTTAEWLEACAAWASHAGDPVSAARLWGLEQVANAGARLGPLDRAKRLAIRNSARAAVGSTTFDRLLAEGRSMSLSDAASRAAELLRKSVSEVGAETT